MTPQNRVRERDEVPIRRRSRDGVMREVGEPAAEREVHRMVAIEQSRRIAARFGQAQDATRGRLRNDEVGTIDVKSLCVVDGREEFHNVTALGTRYIPTRPAPTPL